MPADGAGSCGLGWSPLVSQPWLLESTSGRPLSGIGSCCEHQRGASWLCPEAPSPACPAPPPCPALLWRSAVCLGAGQCQTRGCCCVWSVHSIEGPSLGLGVTPGRGSGCPPGRSEEEPQSLVPGGRAVGKQLPHLLAVALLSPTRRLTRRTCPGGPGPSIAPVKPVCYDPSLRRRTRTLSPWSQATVLFSHLSPSSPVPQTPWVLPVKPQRVAPEPVRHGRRFASVWVVTKPNGLPLPHLPGRGEGLITWPVGAPPTLPRHLWPLGTWPLPGAHLASRGGTNTGQLAASKLEEAAPSQRAGSQVCPPRTRS